MDPNGLPGVERAPETYFLKNIVLYGANKTGKTTLMMDIIHQLKDKIANVYAFAGTPGAYEALREAVPETFLNTTFTLEKVAEIWARQTDAADSYNNANDIRHLQSLFKRVATASELQAEKMIVDSLTVALKRIETNTKMDGSARRRESVKVNKIATEFRIERYKKTISKNTAVLKKMQLTAAEESALRFLHFNPTMLLIVDDCGAMITRKMQADPMFKNLFFMYRHLYMTVIFTFQDDTSLEAPLRKQPSISAFTTDQCAAAFFERSANSFSRDMRIRADRAITYVFGQGSECPKHTKLMYIRGDERELRQYLAEEHEPFRIGGAGIWLFDEQADLKRKAKRTIVSKFGVYSAGQKRK